MAERGDRTHRLERLLQAWAEAERSGDVPRLEALLSADFAAAGPRGDVLSRRQWLDRHISGNLAYTTFTWQSSDIQTYAESAVVVGSQTAEGTLTDEDGCYDIDERLRATLVLVGGASSWQLARLHLGQPS